MVPSEPDAMRARAELGKTWPLGLRIEPFDTYLDELWRLFGDGRVIISTAQRSILLRQVMEHSSEPVFDGPGGIGTLRLLELLVQRAAERSVQDLGVSAGERGTGAQLLRTVAGYERMGTEQGLVERARAHALLPEAVPPGALPGIVAINRFSNLSRGQEAFVVSAAKAAEVWLTLTWIKNFPATADADALVARLAPDATLESAGGTVFSAEPEIARLERQLFAMEACGGPPETTEAAGAVVLSEASGSAMECARVAAEVQDAMRAGIPAQGIAVVFRDLAPRLSLLRTVFSEAGILVDHDAVLPFKSTGLGRAFCLLLGCHAAGGDSKQLFGFLKTPYSGVGLAGLDRMDAKVRQDRGLSVRDALRIAMREDREARKVLGEFDKLAPDGEIALDLTGWDALLGGMLRAAYGTGLLLGEEGRADVAAAGLILAVLRDCATIVGCRLSVGDLLDLLSECKVTLSAEERPGHVQVMTAERIRGRRFACVIVGGVEQGEFPRVVNEDALAAPKVAKRLLAAGIDVSPRAGMDAERLLFYEVVTRPRQRLVLSRRVVDDDGAAVLPSSLLEEMLDLYRDPVSHEPYAGEVPTHRLGAAGFGCEHDAPATRRRELRTFAADVAGEPLGADAPERVVHARWRATRRGSALDETVASRIADRDVFTASEIETYLQCPYRWYVQRVLQPSALEDELDAAERGRAVHALLARFYTRFKEDTGQARVMLCNLDMALRTHAAVAREVADGITTPGFAEQATVRSVVALTKRVVVEDATFLDGFEPTLFEWGFGLGDDEPERFDGFSLRGRVDRIDMGPAGLVVIDYKTGTIKDHQAAKFAESGLVQLPLYLETARRRLAPHEAAGALYRAVGERGKPRGFWREDAISDTAGLVRTDRLDAAGLRSVVDEAIVRAHDAVERMRAGAIEAEPLAEHCPSYCPARPYCEGRR